MNPLVKTGDRVEVHAPHVFKPGRTGIVEHTEKRGAWVRLEHNGRSYWFDNVSMTLAET